MVEICLMLLSSYSFQAILSSNNIIQLRIDYNNCDDWIRFMICDNVPIDLDIELGGTIIFSCSNGQWWLNVQFTIWLLTCLWE